MSRAYNWVSSTEKKNYDSLKHLQKRMVHFYNETSVYYQHINFTANNWNDRSHLAFQAIVNYLSKAERVLEVGCGRANVLSSPLELRSKYTGIDFSKKLIEANSKKYPQAEFFCFETPNELPFEANSFDIVFSTFVLEHCVFPNILLSECSRVLKKGGFLLVLCPDFCGRKNMTSQRVGFSPGSTSTKLHSGKILDAIFTFIDNRFRQPIMIDQIINRSIESPKFYINLNPTCFEDEFYPDCDAVYITNEDEIKLYLEKEISWKEKKANLKRFCKSRNAIFLAGQKL